MVLDKQGGPNWFKNWGVAPVIVDQEKDEGYLRPVDDTLSNFRKDIRSEEHKAERKARRHLVVRLLLEKKKNIN